MGAALKREGALREHEDVARPPPPRCARAFEPAVTSNMAAESGDEYDDDFEIESPSGHGWKDIDFADVELRDKIGGGGFAIVYAGEWRGRPCAVKTLVSTSGQPTSTNLLFQFDPKVDEALKQEYMDELHVMRCVEVDSSRMTRCNLPSPVI